MLQNSSQMIQL